MMTTASQIEWVYKGTLTQKKEVNVCVCPRTQGTVVGKTCVHELEVLQSVGYNFV